MLRLLSLKDIFDVVVGEATAITGDSMSKTNECEFGHYSVTLAAQLRNCNLQVLGFDMCCLLILSIF